MNKLVLASQSPRRKQLLEWAEVDFEVQVSDSDETYPSHLSFPDIAVHIARQKALAIAARCPYGTAILAADTIVVCKGEILGKPTSAAHAVEILAKLSGASHQVITGVTILHPGGETSFADTTSVEFHPLTQEQMKYYVEKYKPYDKAGAYAIQEWIGVVGIKKVEGDFYNVMGLPVSRVVQHLRELAIIP